MKKVIHLTLYLDIGGLERMVFVLCREQKRAGLHPSVFVYERDTGDLLPQFEAEKIPVTFCPKGRGFSPRLLFQILAHLHAQQIQIIHSHDLGALIYASLVRLLSARKIHVVHTQHSFQHLRTRKARLYERIFPWLAERLVCVSEDLRRTYLKLGQPIQRLRLIPNGVDFDVLRSNPKERQEAKQKLIFIHNLPPALVNKKWIVTLGRLTAVKGPHNALAVWNCVDQAAAEGAAMLFVGPETENRIIERLQLAARQEVFFPGPSLDPQLWLRGADLFLSGSEFEGMPMAGLEAAATGLPMLLSQIPGHGIFRGCAGFFPLSNPAAGARQIEAFLAGEILVDDAAKEAARARLETGCGARRMMDRYVRVYGEVIPEMAGKKVAAEL